MTNRSDADMNVSEDSPTPITTTSSGRQWYLVPGLVVVVAAGHFFVDLAASHVMPLWPELERYFSLGGNSIYWMYILWSVSTSVTQFVFGYLGDRWRMDRLIWLAPGLAAICMGSIGLASSPMMACISIALGGIFVAAFHPEGAVLSGNAIPEHRSRALSIFVSGGFIGQMLGPLYGGKIVELQGIPGLVWSIGGGLVFMVVLGCGVMFSQPVARTHIVQAECLERGQRRCLFWIFCIQALRTVSATGIPFSIAFILDARGIGPFGIGVQQSVFMGGIGLGGLLCGMLFRQRHERQLLFWLPLIGAVPLCLLTLCLLMTDDIRLLTVNVALVALTVGMAIPITISFGQRLVPSAPRLASSIAMGVSWGFGAAIAASLTGITSQWERPELVFVALLITTVAAGLLSHFLPREPGDELQGHQT